MLRKEDTGIKSTPKVGPLHSQRIEKARPHAAFFHLTDDGIVYHTPSGPVLDVNPAACELLGYRRDELLRISADALLVPDGEPNDIYDTLFQERVCRHERYLVRKDGRRIHAEICSYLHVQEGDALVVSRIRALDGGRRGEESQQTERALLEAIIDNIPTMLCIWDPQFEEFTFNRELREVLGWTEADCADGDFLSKVYPDPAYRREVIAFMQSLDEGWRDLKTTAKDGGVIDCSWANVQLPDGRCIGIGIDIRQRKQAEAALKKLNETLEERVAARTAEVREKAEQLRSLALELTQAEQRERKRLASILHDHIQQLLVAARLQLGWINKGGDPDLAVRTAAEVSAILNEALSASRNLAMDLSPPVLHEAGLIAALKWLASEMQRKSQFTVRLTTDSGAEPHTEQTRTLLFECVREMLLNTLKHAGVAEAEVALLRVDPRHIRVIISDKGKGFEPDLLEKRRSDELSFGLFSCRERILQIGGDMEIETAPGQGARIILTVPYLGESEKAAAPAQRIRDTRPIRIREKKEVCEVLIADDHKIVREGLAKLLQFEPGIEVVGEAADGPTALRLAHRLQPDVIVMDINMGRYNGIEVTRRILDWYPDIKIIGLSMHTDENIINALVQAGARVCLSKSGPSDELIAKVRECHSGP